RRRHTRFSRDWSSDVCSSDLPCSATGTIRRHPDLPHLRNAGDIEPLVALQARLLDRAWEWLRPGGRLVYAVCSLIPAEGEEQVRSEERRVGKVGRAGWVPEDG